MKGIELSNSENHYIGKDCPKNETNKKVSVWKNFINLWFSEVIYDHPSIY